MITNDFVKELFVFGIFRKNNLKKKNDEKFYSSVWKHEWFLIQSIDWKRIRDADSHIKLFVGNNNCECWKSRFIGGVIANKLIFSVINGPLNNKYMFYRK